MRNQANFLHFFSKKSKHENVSENFKTCLGEWKEIIVFIHAMMVWRTKWFAIITIMSITSLYLYIWLANCSMINMIWTISLLAVLMDYFVCGPLKNILPPDSWDQKKEYTYSVISKLVSKYYLTCKLYVERFFKLRETNTILFHSTLSLLFISLLYFGTKCNNLLLSYITVVFLFIRLKMKSEDVEKSVQEYIDGINYPITTQ